MIFLLFGLAFLILCLYMFKKAHQNIVRYDQINHPMVPQSFNDYKIFFIADVHKRHVNKEMLQSITEEIDIVLIGGDLLEKGVPLAMVKRNVEKLQRWQVPIVFVWGNNDFETNTMKFIELLQELNVIILENECLPIVRDGQKLQLVGFSYDEVDVKRRMEVSWGELDHGFTIVLTHTPSSFKMLDEDLKVMVDIVLCGHTHGGQIRIFGFGPYEKGGVKRLGKTVMFTTEGYGYSLLPFRLETEAQCHVITLNNLSYN